MPGQPTGSEALADLHGKLQKLDLEIDTVSVGLTGEAILLPRRKAMLARIERMTTKVEQLKTDMFEGEHSV